MRYWFLHEVPFCYKTGFRRLPLKLSIETRFGRNWSSRNLTHLSINHSLSSKIIDQTAKTKQQPANSKHHHSTTLIEQLISGNRCNRKILGDMSWMQSLNNKISNKSIAFLSIDHQQLNCCCNITPNYQNYNNNRGLSNFDILWYNECLCYRELLNQRDEFIWSRHCPLIYQSLLFQRRRVKAKQVKEASEASNQFRPVSCQENRSNQ